MLRIYYGPDTYTRSQAVAELERELDADSMLSANIVHFDGAHIDWAALLATCDTVPFLAPQRLVVVSDLLLQAQARPGRAGAGRRTAQNGQSPTGHDALPSYIPRMPDTTTLLLLDGPLNRDNALLRALQPMAEVREFVSLGQQQVLEWVAARARSLGADLEPRAASLLVSSVHAGDLWTLSTEIEKLSLYAAGRTITESTVRRLVPEAQDSNVFAMVDAIVACRLDTALQQLRLLQQEGAAGPYLLTMIARQFRQLIIAEDMSAAGSGGSAIAEATGIRFESAVRRVTQQARRMGARRLQDAYELILEADLAIKRGEMDEDVALDLLITQLAWGEGAPPRVPTTTVAARR